MLIPQLAGSAADPDVESVRAAAVGAAADLADTASEWVILGAGHGGPQDRTGTGTFAGFGADVAVSLSPDAVDDHVDHDWPLPLLIGGWLRGQVAPTVTARAVTIDPAATAQQCADHGRRLRQCLDDAAGAIGLLVVADGAITLTAKAPGGFHDDARGLQDELTAAIGGDPGACERFLRWNAADAAGVDGRAVYQVALAALGRQWDRETSYAAAPFGVGYTIANWSRPR